MCSECFSKPLCCIKKCSLCSFPLQILLLENLILSGNLLHGSIPTTIGLLTKLTTILLYDNHLSGTIPTEIGLLTNLQVFNIALNADITGTIPTEISLLTNLLEFQVGYEEAIKNTPNTTMEELEKIIKSNGNNGWLNSSHLAYHIYNCC